MKGIALQIGGIMMIAVSIATIAIIKSTGWAETTYVTYRGEVALSAVHEVELTRKILNENSYFIAQRAAADMLKVGMNEEPDLDIYKQNLLESIENRLPKGKINTSYPERKISWLGKNLTINPNGCSLDMNSKCFYLEGRVNFSLFDKTIDTKIDSQVPINKKIDSSFFRIVSVAKDIFSNNSFSMNENQLTTQYPGLTFTKTTGEITIEDRSCLSRGEVYCLYPINPSEETGIASDIPFDYLRTRLIIPQPT